MNCRNASMIAVVFQFLLWSGSVLLAQEEGLRQPPSNKELKDAIVSIRKLMDHQYQDKTPKGRAALLKLLQQTAGESADDTLNHYALLSECAFAASKFGAVEEGWSACQEIESRYDVSELPHIDFIKRIKPNLNGYSANVLFEEGVELAQSLIGADEFSVASELAKSLSVSLRSQLPHAKTELESLAARAKLLDRKYKQLKSDFKTLESDPANEKANANVGEFYCLTKGDFEQGLPFLAKSTVSPVQKLAKHELGLQDPTTPERLTTADQWWAMGETKKLKGFKKLAVEQYQSIVEELEGLSKVKVQGRINEAILSKYGKGDTATQLANSRWRIGELSNLAS